MESDETYIGGKVANMHPHKRRRVMGSKRGGTYAKAIVMGMLSRDSREPETERRGPTPWERFVSLARKVTQAPKTEVEKREIVWRERQEQRRSCPKRSR